MREIPREELRRKLRVLNPHWDDGGIDPDFAEMKPRGYFRLLYPLVTEPEVRRAVVLMGPRRVGKTVLIWHTIQQQVADGASPTTLIYASLDTPLFQGMGLEEIISLYREVFPERNVEGCTFFFDEVQYLKDWDVHLKSLVDQYRRTRFLASGSAAAALKRKSVESGAGRFTDFLLPPLTFFEYLELCELTAPLLGERFSSLTAQPPADVPELNGLNSAFLDYLNFGGFPEAVTNERIQQDAERYVRSDIIDKVLLRDLPSLYGIQDIQELNRLFQVLAYQTGSEITYESLAQKSGVAKNTIRKYIEYLESAFLLKTVKRVDDAGGTFKRTNYFKVYLTNPCMYTALFDKVTDKDDSIIGHLVETAIFAQWLHSPRLINELYYARWSKKGGGEVDIVHLENGNVDWCLEVKWSDRYYSKPRELASLIEFCRKTSLTECMVTSQSKHGSIEIEGLLVHFIPAAFYCAILGRNLILNAGSRC